MPRASRTPQSPQQVLAALEAAGTAQNVKIYTRHGVRGPLFGVSYATQNALAKSLGRDTALALALWDSGNHDARVLATMIADGTTIQATDLERMVKDVDSPPLANAFSSLVARTPLLARCVRKWSAAAPTAKNEFLVRCGFTSAAAALRDRRNQPFDPDRDLPDDLLDELLARIEERIQKAPNSVREGMNLALIAIGSYRDGLTEAALAAARRIGKVEIDHGETSCKTSDAVETIQKARSGPPQRSGTSRKPAARKSARSG